MKKCLTLVILSFFALIIFTCDSFGFINKSNFTGRWAEKTSERVVMDIYANEYDNEYKIFITWRENNLAQKDIYRFNGKLDKNGNIQYSSGIHIYRLYNKDNSYEDKVDYTDGSGLIKIKANKLLWIDNKDNLETEFIKANKDIIKDTTIKNKYFSLILPEELRGFYEVKKEKDKISVYHKESKEAGFGGFAFGIKAYKNPADHAVLPGSRKLGELKDKKGILYDIVLKHPTDVQYNYTKSPQVPESFKLLYDVGDVANIQGINGGIYFKNQGMKGEDLYNNILKKHITAIKEGWDSKKLEKENMSYMYNIIKSSNSNALEKVGYAYYDINADGIEELVVGEIADGAWEGVIYDIYTMVNRKPVHVVSGGERNRYYVCNKTFICNEYSSGAMESGMRVYNLVENSTELFPQVYFKYDEYENSNNPYFISYSDEKWQNVSIKTYNERKKIFETYERFNYTPLSDLCKNTKESLTDRFNKKKDYFDYSVVLQEFPKSFYYTTVKINKSKERILIITDKITKNKNTYHGLFYYFGKNGFVYPLGYLESKNPFSQSEDFLYLSDSNSDIKFYISDKNLEVIKSKETRNNTYKSNIQFETIESADRFAGNFGSPAGNDIRKLTLDGFFFEYHKPQYKKGYIKNIMQECINDGVKTQVQMYCCVVKKLHPEK